jgi:hypothetical protein
MPTRALVPLKVLVTKEEKHALKQKALDLDRPVSVLVRTALAPYFRHAKTSGQPGDAEERSR